MIPKIIHYCWFGGKPLPEDAEKCIRSWEKFFPDYEIKRWDESNFNVNIIPYTSQAYAGKKYAFVSDYARFWILYNYGGIYFDTDVEVIRSFDSIIQTGPFMGEENAFNPELTAISLGVNAGLGIGAYPKMDLYRQILNLYKNLKFKRRDGSYDKTTVVTYVTRILIENGLKNTPDIQEIQGIKIYPKEYFCPLDYRTGELTITPNTVSIHQYVASWHTKSDARKDKLIRFLPAPILRFLLAIKRIINR